MFHDRSLPEKFLERLTEMFGVSLFREIEKTFVERCTTFRINTIKGKKEEVIEVLNQNGFKIRQVSWYKDAFVLLNKSKRELTDLDIYNEGKIYIQSLASMIPSLVLDPQPGEKVLDLTAAPGSKTSQIAALMNRQGELIVNDNNKVRFFKLKHNMESLGVIPTDPEPVRGGAEGSLFDTQQTNKNFNLSNASDVQLKGIPRLPLDSTSLRSVSLGVARNDSWKFTLRMEYGSSLCGEFHEHFDRVLLDAPCSAEARFIKGEPKTFGYWKERKIKEMAYKQWGLLLAAWSALKPGGILVYSTCTFAPEENELQITKFLERVSQMTTRDLTPSPLLQGEGMKCAEILPAQGWSAFGGDIRRLPIVKTWKNKTINPEVVKKAMRIMPTKEIEGFFVVKLKKV